MRSSIRIAPFAAVVVITAAWAGPVKAIRLDKTKSFPPAYQKAASAVSAELRAKGEKPENFYAETTHTKTGALIFHLWSSENYHLLKSNRPVNPGGGILVTVNPMSGAILETVFEQ